MQFLDLKRIWKVSRMDAAIWISAFLGVVIIDIDYGLLLGILVSLIVLLCRTQQPKTCRLGHIPNTDLYLDVSKYSAVSVLWGIPSHTHIYGMVYNIGNMYDNTTGKIVVSCNEFFPLGNYVTDE